jgi:hypothetical protein
MYTADSLKKRSSNLDKLSEKINQMNKGGYEKDERFWELTVDKNGNGQATIRFLPEPGVDGEEALPFVQYWTHSFKGPTGKWYIENCRSTLGMDVSDPVMEMNNWLWNTKGDEKSKEFVSKSTKRRLYYVSNILVVDDPANPDNNGKVFLFRYGQKIFEMINGKLNPEFEGDERVNVFDPIEGANFKLRAMKKDGFRNYDKSFFEEPSAMFGDDFDKMADTCNKAHSLLAFNKPEFFKSYEELSKKLDRVMGYPVAKTIAAELGEGPDVSSDDSDDDMVDASSNDNDDDTPPFDVDNESSSEGDDDLDYFKKIAG